MAKKIGKVEIAADVIEPETEASGKRAGDVPPGAPPPRMTRFGAGGEGGGGRRERGIVGRQSFFARLGQFLRDTRSEMKRVSWPTVKEVKNTTIITLVAVIFFAIYLFLVDRVWAYLLIGLNRLLLWMTGG